jgi:hypothetical protein
MLVKGVELDRGLAHSRKVPRKIVDWSGRYIAEQREGAVWQKCSVVDISVLGVGVELFGAVPPDPMGDRIAVAVHANADGRVRQHPHVGGRARCRTGKVRVQRTGRTGVRWVVCDREIDCGHTGGNADGVVAASGPG